MNPCIWITVAITAISGCTVDMTTGRLPGEETCNVHDTRMSPQVIQMSSGESIYVMDYVRTARRSFPNHGGVRMLGEVPLPAGKWDRFAAKVLDYVCADCTAAYDQYLADQHAVTDTKY